MGAGAKSAKAEVDGSEATHSPPIHQAASKVDNPMLEKISDDKYLFSRARLRRAVSLPTPPIATLLEPG